MLVSLWNIAGSLAVAQLRHLPNFRIIRKHSCAFETLWDLTIRRLVRYWILLDCCDCSRGELVGYPAVVSQRRQIFDDFFVGRLDNIYIYIYIKKEGIIHNTVFWYATPKGPLRKSSWLNHNLTRTTQFCMLLPDSRHTTIMMTSSNGNIFRVTGPLCGEFTGYRWNPRTKASDAELWCFLWSAPE